MNKYSDKETITNNVKEVLKSCPEIRLQELDIETTKHEWVEVHVYFLTFVVGGSFKTLPFRDVHPFTFAATDKEDGTLTFEWFLQCNALDTLLSDVEALIVTINEVMTDLYFVEKTKVIQMPEMEVGKSYQAVEFDGELKEDKVYTVVEINHAKLELKTIDNHGKEYTWFLEHGKSFYTYWREV